MGGLGRVLSRLRELFVAFACWVWFLLGLCFFKDYI